MYGRVLLAEGRKMCLQIKYFYQNGATCGKIPRCDHERVVTGAAAAAGGVLTTANVTERGCSGYGELQ